MNDTVRHSFEVLEIPPESSYQQARSAYRLLVQVWHPDKHCNSEQIYAKATNKLKEINAAWNCIQEHFKDGSLDNRAESESMAREAAEREAAAREAAARDETTSRREALQEELKEVGKDRLENRATNDNKTQGATGRKAGFRVTSLGFFTGIALSLATLAIVYFSLFGIAFIFDKVFAKP